MDYKYVGKPIPIRDALLKVTGKNIYTGDMKFPDMLHCKMLFSPVPHARIKNIDTRDAEKLPGVRAVATHLNSPQVYFNSAQRFVDHIIPEDELLFSPIVRYVGDRVAAVAADTLEIAKQAIKLIKIEYEELPAVFDPEEALLSNTVKIHSKGNLIKEMKMEAGDFEASVSEADHSIESRVTTPRVHHGAIETHITIASYSVDEKFTLWTTNQNVFATRLILAKIFNKSFNKVHVIKPPLGGAFGGKLEVVLEPIAALLAKMTGQTVRLELTRKETIISTRTRHPAIIYIKSAVKNNGTIIGREVKVITNTGAYTSSALNVMGAMSSKFFSIYRIPNLRFIGMPVYTNTPIAGAMRGYGSPQLVTAMEIHMDEIARKLNMDPIDIRAINLVKPFDKDPRNNRSIGNSRVLECLKAGAEAFRWSHKVKSINPDILIGYGVSCGIHGNGVFPAHRDLTAMSLLMNEDGSAILHTGTHDLGAGSNTIFTQIIAEIIGIKPDKIEVVEADTEKTGFDLGAYASRNTWVGGSAAKLLAEKILTKFNTLAAEILNENAADIKQENGYYFSTKSLSEKLSIEDIIKYSYKERQEPVIEAISYSSPSGPFSYGVHFARVAINIKTGEVTITDFTAVHDVGKAINPMLVEGQIHGGIQMGIGYALFEDLPIDVKTGRLLNTNLKKYHIPKAKDMPKNTQVILVEKLEDGGPFGAKSIGEIATVPSAAAIINAVNNALNTSFKDLPVTKDTILTTIKPPLY